jgi:hypothetical protein
MRLMMPSSARCAQGCCIQLSHVAIGVDTGWAPKLGIAAVDAEAVVLHFVAGNDQVTGTLKALWRRSRHALPRRACDVDRSASIFQR